MFLLLKVNCTKLILQTKSEGLFVSKAVTDITIISSFHIQKELHQLSGLKWNAILQ